MLNAGALVLAAVLTASPTNKADVDLDGDGTREHLTLEVAKPGAFRLTVGTAVTEGELPGVCGVTVLDLDSSDKQREVLVHGESRFRLFRQEGTALREVPLPPGVPSASGNGILLCDVPMSDGWARRDKYLYDAKQPGFTEVPQELYAVGRDLPPPGWVSLQQTPGSKDVVTLAGPENALSLHAFKPDFADRDGGWYLAGLARKSEDALGWVSARELRKKVSVDDGAMLGAIVVLPELYASGARSKVATSFPLLRTRQDDAEPVAKLRAGSTVTLLATDGTWYLIQSETRLLGWARAGALSALKKAPVPDKRAQLSTLQHRLRSAMPKPTASGDWRPDAAGLILENEYASTLDTYHFCPDGRVVLEFLVDDYKKHGTWTLDRDTLKLAFTRETKQLGVGEPIGPPEGVEGVRQYRETTPHEATLAETQTLDWNEVLEDVKTPSSSYKPRRGNPSCR
ncbi:SH3 domain-containing protein [Myxococcus faecalis]|uniref:hypothetical protein n=1 Tax=Myxococcus faecalis TaxID=3115646 RepID=UPI003CF22A3A